MSTDAETVLFPQQPRLSGAVEIGSKVFLLVSAALYGIGLLIANFNAQVYGRYSLGLLEAQYVLVGMLWLSLTLLTFALLRSAGRWISNNGPWKGRALLTNLRHGILAFSGCAGLLAIYLQVLGFLGIDHPYWGWKPLAILAILVGTNISLGALFGDTMNDIVRLSAPTDSLLVRLWKADSIAISKRILGFFVVLSFYAIFAYPNLLPAVGGGRLHEAEFLIRQDKRPLFDLVPELRIENREL
jgi:hypothetical protein